MDMVEAITTGIVTGIVTGIAEICFEEIKRRKEIKNPNKDNTTKAIKRRKRKKNSVQRK